MRGDYFHGVHFLIKFKIRAIGQLRVKMCVITDKARLDF